MSLPESDQGLSVNFTLKAKTSYLKCTEEFVWVPPSDTLGMWKKARGCTEPGSCARELGHPYQERG